MDTQTVGRGWEPLWGKPNTQRLLAWGAIGGMAPMPMPSPSGLQWHSPHQGRCPRTLVPHPHGGGTLSRGCGEHPHA